MGLCKCRKCGEVASSKAWSAGKEAACPHCGHTQFSISFPGKPAAPTPQPAPLTAELDAHGRRRKVIRLEHLTGATPTTSKPGFHERMQALKGRVDPKDPGEE